jgi:hypothetical protein
MKPKEPIPTKLCRECPIFKKATEWGLVIKIPSEETPREKKNGKEG